MRMLILFGLSFVLAITGCSSIGSGVEVFNAADLGKDGLPKFSENGGTTGTKLNAPSNEQYVIKPGDQLSVKFFFNPELNEENLIVRPDGRISLQLIHEVEAAGLTSFQLTSLLSERYKGQLKNPEIAVIVRSVKEVPSVYIDGQVKDPGVIEIVGKLNVLQAVVLAKGFKEDTARKDAVVITRQGHGGHSYIIELDLLAAINGEDLTQNILLLPGDFVHVPRSYW